MSDLVERVRAHLDLIPDEFRYESPTELVELLDQCLTALSPSKDDEVAGCIAYHTVEGDKATAALIERLSARVRTLKRRPTVAKFNALQEECGGRMKAIEKLRERIAELEQARDFHLASVAKAVRESREIIAELEQAQRWISVSGGLKCPNSDCNDSGGFPVLDGYGGCEQQQCEFCWTVPDSVFSRNNPITPPNDKATPTSEEG